MTQNPAAPTPSSTRSETAILTIQGMSCQHCVQTVQQALARTPGVGSAVVDLARAEARVEYDPAAVSLARLVEAIQASGFVAPSFKRNPRPQ